MASKKSKSELAKEAAARGKVQWDPQFLAAVTAQDKGPGGSLSTATAPAPPQHWVEGTPGVPTPTPQPFMTGSQMAANAEKQGFWRQSIIDIDKGLADLESITGVQQTELESSRIKSRDNVRNDTASKGFTGSSVQDGDLFDIDAMARLRREYMTTNLDTAKITAGNKKSAIEDEKDAWGKAMDQQQVENVQAVSAIQPPWITEPTTGHMAPGAAAPAGAAPPQKGLKPQVPIGGQPPRPANQSATKKGTAR